MNWKDHNKKQKRKIISFIKYYYPNVNIRDIINETYSPIIKNNKLIGVKTKL